MERERGEVKSKDETGFSEKQLDIDIETGAFKKRSLGKTVIQKKRKK